MVCFLLKSVPHDFLNRYRFKFNKVNHCAYRVCIPFTSLISELGECRFCRSENRLNTPKLHTLKPKFDEIGREPVLIVRVLFFGHEKIIRWAFKNHFVVFFFNRGASFHSRAARRGLFDQFAVFDRIVQYCAKCIDPGVNVRFLRLSFHSAVFPERPGSIQASGFGAFAVDRFLIDLPGAEQIGLGQLNIGIHGKSKK